MASTKRPRHSRAAKSEIALNPTVPAAAEIEAAEAQFASASHALDAWDGFQREHAGALVGLDASCAAIRSGLIQLKLRAQADLRYTRLIHGSTPLSQVVHSSPSVFAKQGAWVALLLGKEAQTLLTGPDDGVLERLKEVANDSAGPLRVDIMAIITSPPVSLGAILAHARGFSASSHH